MPADHIWLDSVDCTKRIWADSAQTCMWSWNDQMINAVWRQWSQPHSNLMEKFGNKHIVFYCQLCSILQYILFAKNVVK